MRLLTVESFILKTEWSFKFLKYVNHFWKTSTIQYLKSVENNKTQYFSKKKTYYKEEKGRVTSGRGTGREWVKPSTFPTTQHHFKFTWTIAFLVRLNDIVLYIIYNTCNKKHDCITFQLQSLSLISWKGTAHVVLQWLPVINTLLHCKKEKKKELLFQLIIIK